MLQPQTLLFFALFVVPGYLMVEIFDLRVPSERRDFGRELIRIVSLSLLNFAALSWAFYLARDSTGWLITVSLITIFISPLALTAAYVWLRTTVAAGVTVKPYPSGWDYFFDGSESGFWIRFHLKDGRRVAGYFGDSSYAPPFPRPQQVYVERLYELADDGTTATTVSGSAGATIKAEDCEMVEFLAAMPVRDTTPRSDGSANGEAPVEGE